MFTRTRSLYFNNYTDLTNNTIIYQNTFQYLKQNSENEEGRFITSRFSGCLDTKTDLFTTKILFFILFSERKAQSNNRSNINTKKYTADAVEQLNSSCSKYISLKEKPRSKINLRRCEGSTQVELMLGQKHTTNYRSEDVQNK